MIRKCKKGFTLVELLVVIAVIGILAVVAVPALFKNIEKAKVADLEADISAIRSAVLDYYADTSNLGEGTQNFWDKDDTGKISVNLVGGKEHPSEISEKIEDLGMPFYGKYILNAPVFEEGYEISEVTLTIMAKSGYEFSDNVVEKLKNDLNDMYKSRSDDKRVIEVILIKGSKTK